MLLSKLLLTYCSSSQNFWTDLVYKLLKCKVVKIYDDWQYCQVLNIQFCPLQFPSKNRKINVSEQKNYHGPATVYHHQKEILWGDYDRVVKIDTLKMSRRRIWRSRQYQRLPANCSLKQAKQQQKKWPVIASVTGTFSKPGCFHCRCLLLLVWVVWVELKQKLLWLQAALEWWQRYEICVKIFQSANVILIYQWCRSKNILSNP